MGFGLSVRRLVTEIIEHNHLKFAENRKITFFFTGTSETEFRNFLLPPNIIIQCISSIFFGGGNQTFFLRAALA